VAVAALAAAAVAYAQPCGGEFGAGMGYGNGPGMGYGNGPGMRYGMGPGMGMWHGPRGDHAAVVDGRLEYMKSALNITSAQESAWQTFSSASKAEAASMDAMRQKMGDSAGTAPSRMAAHAEAMQQRAAAMAAVSKAFEGLYAVLTPEQRAIADEHFGGVGPRAMRYGRRAA
jgi:hypothetical protein